MKIIDMKKELILFDKGFIRDLGLSGKSLEGKSLIFLIFKVEKLKK